MSKKLGCVITDKEKDLLVKLAKKTKKNQGELIGYLLRSYDRLSDKSALKDISIPLDGTPSDNGIASQGEPVISLEAFNLSSLEQQEVENALINSDSQIEEVARDGLLQRSRYLNSIANKQAKLESMSDEEMRSSTFKGAANFRIEQVIETIVNHNNSQSEKSSKVCITKGIIFKLTGSNRQTINKWFDEHEVMISDHNSKHSLTDADNRKGKGFDWEELLGV